MVTDKNLISLEEWNRRVRQAYRADYGAKPNGIACPACGQELVDLSEDAYVRAPGFGKKRIACCHCDFTGERYA